MSHCLKANFWTRTFASNLVIVFPLSISVSTWFLQWVHNLLMNSFLQFTLACTFNRSGQGKKQQHNLFPCEKRRWAVSVGARLQSISTLTLVFRTLRCLERLNQRWTDKHTEKEFVPCTPVVYMQLFIRKHVKAGLLTENLQDILYS